MTTIRPHLTWRATLTNRGFVIHYLQMLAAMFAGMLLLIPLAMLVDPGGAGIVVHALLMATSMVAGMAAWMGWRRHSWVAITQMSLAMYLAFGLLLPLYWLGALTEGGLIALGHVVMLPAMAVAMLLRRDEYVTHH